MNVFFIGYYDDFSRFFLTLKHSFKKYDKDINVNYYSLYFSGFLYWLIRSRGVTLISFKAMFLSFIKKRQYNKVDDNYRGIDVGLMIDYHVKLGVNPNNLKRQACAYVDVLFNEFEKLDPKIVICSSDSRLIAEVLKGIAKKYNTQLFFFEQGPYGTTVIDKFGVNANSSIRGFVSGENRIIDRQVSEINEFPKRENKLKYKRFFLYRLCDFFLERILNPIDFYPVDITKSTSFNLIKPTSNISKNNLSNSKKRKFLLILQVPFDVNMVNHSPFFSNHYEIVKSVSEALPENSELIIREHPLFYNKYELDLYNYIDKHSLILDSSTPLDEAINNCDVVIVNNSTVGLEAISLNMPTVVLGDSFYDSSEICIKLDSIARLNICLRQALEFKIDKSKKIGFLDKYYFDYLFEGHFRDNDLTCLCEKISKFCLKDKK
ncbi:hypothetical protein [Vibrio sp. OPT10]|uniref:capsular polysaccharide export protein, LipB/KpsS family n=1 Tax=Vibrio sp. OPT10 TaxID=2778640 RepID=UPI00188258BF|nr:hypothetical protein [Vibrio sp. OPT10]MBE8607848.1 hypothetical protein [Vibrio sp. OPT10]